MPLDEYLAQDPNLTITVFQPFPGGPIVGTLSALAGQVDGGIWANFVGNVDNFTIAFDDSCTTYDFECSAPAAAEVTVTSIKPETLGVPEGAAQEALVPVTITGTGFSSLSLPISVSGGAGISVLDVVPVSDTVITFKAQVSRDAQGGARDVSVAHVTAAGLLGVVRVDSLSVGILGVPATAADEAAKQIVIRGSGLEALTGNVAVFLGDGVTVTAVNVVMNGEQATADVGVIAGASEGARVLEIKQGGHVILTRSSLFKLVKVSASGMKLCVEDAAGIPISFKIKPPGTSAVLVFENSPSKPLPEGTSVSALGLVIAGSNSGSGQVDVKVEGIVVARADVDVFRIMFNPENQEICQTIKTQDQTSPGVATLIVTIEPAGLASDVFFTTTSLEKSVSVGDIATINLTQAVASPQTLKVTAANPATNPTAKSGAIRIDAHLGSATGPVCGTGATVTFIDDFEVLPGSLFLCIGDTFELAAKRCSPTSNTVIEVQSTWKFEDESASDTTPVAAFVVSNPTPAEEDEISSPTQSRVTLVAKNIGTVTVRATEAGGSKSSDKASSKAAETKAAATDVCSVTVGDVQFIDKFGRDSGNLAAFSDPHPVVTIEQAAVSQVDEEFVTFSVSGNVRDELADMVGAGRADPAEVVITGMAGDIRVGVTRVSEPDRKDTLHPFAAKYIFGPVQVDWLASKGTNVLEARATNAIGNLGVGSFTFDVPEIEPLEAVLEGDVVESSAVGKVVITKMNPVQVTDITIPQPTEAGLLNPIRVTLNLPTDASVPTTFTFFGSKFEWVGQDGKYEGDVPFMAIAKDPAQPGAAFPGTGIPNVVNLKRDASPRKFQHGACKKEFYFAWTEGSPPVKPRLAAGTVVELDIRSSIFGAGLIEDNSKITGFVIRKTGGPRFYGDEDKKVSANFTIKPDPANPKVGIMTLTNLTIQKDAYEPSGDNDRTLEIRSSVPIGGKIAPIYFTDIFRIVPLKVVVLALDGAGYNAVRAAISGGSAPNLQKVFDPPNHPAINLDAPVLAHMPTVTFCNWPCVFSGDTPAQTGVTGNAFFQRDLLIFPDLDIRPFASAQNDFILGNNVASVSFGDQIDNLQATLGRLPNLAHGPANTLFDKSFNALPADQQMDARLWSLNSFWPKFTALSITENLVRENFQHTLYPTWPLRRRHFRVESIVGLFAPKLAAIIGGIRLGKRIEIALEKFDDDSLEAAVLLDSISTADAICAWDVPDRNIPDLTALYYPGPDNVAHAFGALSSRVLSSHFDSLARGEETIPVMLSGVVGNLDHNLQAYIERVTDKQFGLFLKNIEERGWLNATVFCITADHGQLGIANDEAHNLYISDMGPLVEAAFDEPTGNVFYDLWRGTFIKDQTVVYSPNGGLAHIYVRNSKTERWSKLPDAERVERIARRLWRNAAAQPGGNPDDVFVPKLRGALGQPDRVAILLRVEEPEDSGQFIYKWVSDFSGERPMNLELTDLATLYGGEAAWPQFEARMNAELNGSRSGDIIILPDIKSGYGTFVPGDALHGWHGGPSKEESEVPLMFNTAPRVEQKLLNEIFGRKVPSRTEQRRNSHLTPMVEAILKEHR